MAMSNFATIAGYLHQIHPDPHARLRYDLFADALVWSDEMQPVGEGDLFFDNIGIIRAVLHYRTTLILGAPRQEFQPAWEEAQRLCPGWPVFVPQRRDPSLAATFVSLRESSRKKWDEDVARIEQQINDSNRKAIA
jgi:hypothetical protein